MPSAAVNDDNTKKQHERLIWRRDVIRHLRSKSFDQEANDMQNCGCSFFVDVCPTDPSHEPKPVALHCGLRICPECEARESWRKLSRYLPALKALLEPNPDYPDYRLRKLVLTTPYGLTDLTSKTFGEKQKLVRTFFEVFFYEYFEKRGELSKSEIRRHRCDLKKHGIGGLRSSEFGERGKKLHWHNLVYSPYMPHEDVVRVWKQVTGDECQIAHVSALYADKRGEIEDRVSIELAVKEVVKYATKFTSLRPRDVPHLLRVLKGNRRFEAFGILYGQGTDEAEFDHTCQECGVERENTTVTEYLRRCESKSLPPDDVVTDAVDNGIALRLSRDTEISSGNITLFRNRARESLEGEDAHV